MLSEDVKSPFLRIPREIRDMIYDYVLVRGTIVLEQAVTKAPRSLVAVGGEIGFCEALYQKHKLRYPLDSRSTWEVPLEDLAVPESKFQLDSYEVCMTYQLAVPDNEQATNTSKTIDLSIMQVSRQVFHESAEVFYSRNTFSFISDFSIPTAAMFLRDRPASLHFIQSVELSLSEREDEPIEERSEDLAAAEANCEEHRQTLDAEWTEKLTCHKLLPKPNYAFYLELCGRLSSPEMNLRRLSLIIENLSIERTNANLNSISDYIDYTTKLWAVVDGDWARTGICVSEWVHPLLHIKTLDHLKVFWINGLHVRDIGQTASLMERYMLRRRTPLDTQSSLAVRCVDLLYRRVEPFEEQGQSNGEFRDIGARITYNPVDYSVAFSECKVCDDGQKLFETVEDAPREPELERIVVKERINHYGAALTTFFEFGAT